MMEKSAIFSPCRKYRYVLKRSWKREKGYALFCCLNPSTADENFDDPTIRRCIGFANSWGCGGMVMVNLFAYRSTIPDALRDQQDPVGPENNFHILEQGSFAKITVAAWGNHGAYLGRGDFVRDYLLLRPYHMGLTNGGFPKHPLYLKATTEPQNFRETTCQPRSNGRPIQSIR